MDNKFETFLKVINECNIKTGYDFAHFMSVINEHCLDKGITDYSSILECWKKHVSGLVEIANNVKSK